MYSKDSGATWGTVARNVHPLGSSSGYRMYDYIWLVTNTMSVCAKVCMYGM